MKTLYAKNADEWRSWLQRNQSLEKEVWLIFYKKSAGVPNVSFDEALDWALCFGWIDSVIRKIDDIKYARRFTPRRPGSIWSKSNIERVKTLIADGKMTQHGAALFRERSNKISLAEKFKAHEPPFPPEFMSAIRNNGRAWENFQRLAPGHRRRYLMWITSAKTTETRNHRIEEAVRLIARNVRSLMK